MSSCIVERDLEPLCNFIRNHGSAAPTLLLTSLCTLAKSEVGKLDLPQRENFDCAKIDQTADELFDALKAIAPKCNR